MIVGVAVGVLMYAFAPETAAATRLQGLARPMAFDYLRLLSWSRSTLHAHVRRQRLPARRRRHRHTRGEHDLRQPPQHGRQLRSNARLVGFPVLGFQGIAPGTMIAYITGGVLQFVVLCIGTRGAKLYICTAWRHIGTPSNAS